MPLSFESSSDDTIVVSDPAEVEAILQEHFGFEVDVCTSVLQAGYARAALATSNSAKGQFGSDFYFGVIEVLRSELATKGYDGKVTRRLEVARRTDNRLQLTSFMACAGAGQIAGQPNPKNPKGASTRQAIHDNQGTLGLLEPGVAWNPIETWWLLYQVNGVGLDGSISAELSLPHQMSSAREFGWKIRLILPTVELGLSSQTPSLPAPASEVDVPIVRRVG